MIGSGPGGYVASIKAAQLGMKVSRGKSVWSSTEKDLRHGARDFRFRCGELYFALTLSAYNTKYSVNLGSVDSRKNLFTQNKTFLEVNVAQYQPKTQAIAGTIQI